MAKYTGAHEIMQRLREAYQKRKESRVILIKLEDILRDSLVDYRELWAVVSVQTDWSVRDWDDSREDGKSQFESLLHTMLMGATVESVLILLDNPGRGYEPVAFELIKMLDALSGAIERRNGTRLQFVVCDDFSYWHYERYVDEVKRSTFQTIRRVIGSLLDKKEIEACVVGVWPKMSAAAVRMYVDFLSAVTGGHLGLLREILEGVAADQLSSADLEEAIKRTARNGSVLEHLRRDLMQDPAGLCGTAIEYRSPALIIENESVRPRLLRELGVLHWCSETQLVLCPGLISELVTQLGSIKRDTRIGTIAGAEGIKIFEDRKDPVTDGDFVVLHISDLHVGKDHAFRLCVNKKPILNGDRETLDDLIRRDVERMGLEQRIDLLIVSGDLACTGTAPEYLRCGTIIGELAKALNINNNNIVMVPGNHDRDWTASQISESVAGDATVSDEAYRRFADSLGCHIDDGYFVKTIVSRDKMRCLHVVALDTNTIEGPQAGGIGYISREVLNSATVELSKRKKAAAPEIREHITWVVVHHHVIPVTSDPTNKAKKGKVSVMSNAPDLLARVKGWSGEVVLHGHQHQPIVATMERWLGEARLTDFNPVTIVGAGSCGAKKDELGPMGVNHYFVHLRRGDELIVRSRVLGPDELEFTAHVDLMAFSRKKRV